MRHVWELCTAVPGLDVAVPKALKRCLVGVDFIDQASEREELSAADFFLGIQVGDCLWGNAVWRTVSGWGVFGGCLIGGGLDFNGAVEKEKEIEGADVLILSPALDKPFHAVDPGFAGGVTYVRDVAGS